MNIEQIRNRLTEKVKGSKPLGKKLKFHLDDEFILIDGTGNENIVSANDADADCTLTMSLETYLKIQRKEMKPFTAMVKGQMKVKGDKFLAKKFGEIT